MKIVKSKIFLLIIAILFLLIFIPHKTYATYELTEFYFDYMDVTITLPETISLDTDNYNYFVSLTYDFLDNSSFYIYSYYIPRDCTYVYEGLSNNSSRPLKMGAYNASGESQLITLDYYTYYFDTSKNTISLVSHTTSDTSNSSSTFNFHDFPNGNSENFYVHWVNSSGGRLYSSRKGVLLYSDQNGFCDSTGNLVFLGGPLTQVSLITARHLNPAQVTTEITKVLKVMIPIAMAVFSAFLVIFLIRYLISRSLY